MEDRVLLNKDKLTHLQQLESESIHIMREGNSKPRLTLFYR